MAVGDTCSGETPSQASDETVLWTTVLFALVGSGMNTMLQPAGSVCDGEPTLGPMLRSSPIVCIVDACYLLCRLIYFYLDTGEDGKRSLKRAHLRLLQQRYQPWDDGPRASDHGGDNEAGHKQARDDEAQTFNVSTDSDSIHGVPDKAVDGITKEAEAKSDESGEVQATSGKVDNDETDTGRAPIEKPNDLQLQDNQPQDAQPRDFQPDGVPSNDISPNDVPNNQNPSNEDLSNEGLSNDVRQNGDEAMNEGPVSDVITNDRPRPITFFGLLQTLTFRFATFGLMMIPTIKFFAFSGLIWSKVILGSYIISWIVVELTSAWSKRALEKAKHYTGDREGLESSGFDSLSYISVALAVAFLSYFGACALRDAFEGPHGQFGQYLTLFTFSSWIIPFMFVHVFCIQHGPSWCDWNDTILPTILLLPMLILPWSYWIFNSQITAAFKQDVWIQTACIGLVTAWVLIGAKYASAVTRRVRKLAGEGEGLMISHRKFIELFLAWWFAGLHLVTAVLYLLYSYETAGTSKPLWTKWLD